MRTNFKNKTGQWEVRDDGATFTGEVVLDIVWSNVTHAAKTTHTYQGDDYRAVAFQEGKRRTATNVVFPWTYHSEYFCEVTFRAWQQGRKATSA